MQEKVKFVNRAAISALTIGIIGSALWEKLINPFSDYCFSKLIPFFNWISSNFSDILYCQVPMGVHEDSSQLLLSFFFFGLIVIFGIVLYSFCETTFYSCRRSRRTARYTSSNTTKSSSPRKMQYVLVAAYFLVYLLLIFVSIYFIGRNSFINSKAIRAFNTIEIVSPYISDLEYKQLKSDFYLINSEADYLVLTEKLKAIVVENNLYK